MNKKLLRLAAFLASFLVVVSCDDGGGIVGTGIVVTGIISSTSGGVANQSAFPSDQGYFGLTPEAPAGFPILTATPTLCFGNVYQRPVVDQVESSINPPAWLEGNWIGQREDMWAINIVATHDNIAFGDPTLQTSIANGPNGRDVVEVESTASIYRIVVRDEFDGESVTHVLEYAFIDDNRIRYSLVDSDVFHPESIIMNSQLPADAINPPSWLIGEWREEQCETRIFSEGEVRIEYDNADPSISFADLLSGNQATFQTQYVDDEQYMIIGSYLSPDDGRRLRFQELYVLREDGTVEHTTLNKIQILTRR